MRKSIIFFLFTQLALSQTEISVPAWKPDNILRYDTMFQIKPINNLDTDNLNESLFDEVIIKNRLEKLNQTTPINLAYNKVVLQHIKFYLLQRPEQVSKLLALSEYYFPIFEEILNKNELPLELKYLPII